MNRRDIPVYELSEYRFAEVRTEGVFVEKLEDTLTLRPNRVQPHYHHFFQVFLISGKGVVMHDFTERSLPGAAIFFTSPGQVHALKPATVLNGIVVSFSQLFFDHTTPPPSALLDFPFFFTSGAIPLLPLNAEQERHFHTLFSELLHEFRGNQSQVEDVLRAYLRIVFTRAARLYAKAHDMEATSRPAQLVQQFRLLVENRFRELTALNDYAALLKVTPNHLNDTVRAQTAHSAGELIRLRQLLEAKRLLLHSTLSISEVGYHLNFQDPSYFSRFFRRYTEQSPADFRAEIREKYQSSPE